VKTSTETLIKAMRILSSDIQSDDGVANAAIAEAAQRLEEQKDRIKRLEEALAWYESTVSDCNRHGPQGDAARHALAQDRGSKAKEAKP
jgi:hypothetical protein